jgi:Type IV secretion-system coupling protein DNA-binding domain
MPDKYTQEDAQNRWQMGFHSLVRLLILSLFLGAAVSFIWWQLRAPPNSFYYLFQYSYSWAYCQIPFGCSEVATYNLRVLQPLMNQLGELIKSCGTVFSVTSFLTAALLRYYFVRYAQEVEKKRYIRGAKLLKPKELNAEIDAARDNQGRIKYPPKASDLYLGRELIRLPNSLSYRHLGVSGISGTGKTQLLNSILKQLEALRGQKCFLLDLNGQYYSRFGQPGDIILSLQDSRASPWSFYAEKVPPEFFAQALVSTDEGGSSNFFGNAGRAIITDTIARNDSNEGVWGDLTSETPKLLEKLKGGLSPALLGAPEQAAGVIATATVELGFLQRLNCGITSKDYFSLTDWVLSQSDDWVFLIVKDIDLAATKTLLRLWVSLAVGGILQREENKDYPHIWILCDELPGLGVLPDLDKLLSQGRKYKATMIAGYQVRAQIEKLYGKEGAKEIVAGLQNKVIFRTPDPSDAKEESLTLGEQEVEEVTSNAQLGAGAVESDHNSLQRGIKTRPVVMASELQNLPDMKAYVKLCEFDPCLISFDYLSLPTINEPTQHHLPEKNPKLDHENENNDQTSPPEEIEGSTQENTLTSEGDSQWDK